MCEGTDAGGSAELCSMQSLMCNMSEYTEELRRCIRDTLEKHGVQYAGLYSDTILAGITPNFQVCFSSQPFLSLKQSDTIQVCK